MLPSLTPPTLNKRPPQNLSQKQTERTEGKNDAEAIERKKKKKLLTLVGSTADDMPHARRVWPPHHAWSADKTSKAPHKAKRGVNRLVFRPVPATEARLGSNDPPKSAKTSNDKTQPRPMRVPTASPPRQVSTQQTASKAASDSRPARLRFSGMLRVVGEATAVLVG